MGLTTLLIDSLLSTPEQLGLIAKTHRNGLPAKNAQGVEVELEFSKGKDFPEFKYWSTKGDGSLRHIGVEFLFRNPIADRSHLKDAFNEFESAIRGSKLVNSLRTSTHVHHNVADKIGLDIISIFGVYWVVEDLLMDFCGESRKGNFNCLSNSMTQAVQETLQSSLRSLSNNPTLKKNFFNNKTIYDIADNNYRYSSLNPAAIRLFGSVEFRGMRELVTSKELYRWSRIIQCLISYATDRPFDVTLRRFHRMTPTEIIQDIFQDYSKNILAEASPDWEDSMIEALLSVQNLKNSLWTWDREELTDFKKKCDASLEEEKKKNPEKYPVGYARATATGNRVNFGAEIDHTVTRARATGVEVVDAYPIRSIPHHVFSRNHKSQLQDFLNNNRRITPTNLTAFSMVSNNIVGQLRNSNIRAIPLRWASPEIDEVPQGAVFRFIVGASTQRGSEWNFEVFYLQWTLDNVNWTTISIRFTHDNNTLLTIFEPVTPTGIPPLPLLPDEIDELEEELRDPEDEPRF